jgi:hypothetical protein
MALCIPKQINRQLKVLLETGKIDSDKFLKMTSEQREEFLGKYMTENGKPLPEVYKKEINSQIVNKFKTELSPEQYKLISDSYKRLDKIKTEKGVGYLDTPEQVKKYLNLSKEERLRFDKEQINKNLEWTRKYVEMGDKLQEMIDPNSSFGWWKTLKNTAKEEIMKTANASGVLGKAGQAVSSSFNIITSPMLKALKASWDVSYLFRQGFKVLTKDPAKWAESAKKSLEIWKNITNKKEMQAAMNEFKAEIMADPFYDRIVNKGKTAVGVVEDIFPDTFIHKFPGLGSLFKASDEAFTVFMQNARYGIAKDLAVKQMNQVGRELTNAELKSIGYIANSMTGRGSLGRLEAASGIINKLLFSGRYIRSQMDTFLMPFNPQLSSFARKEALKHSGWTLGSIATLIASAKMMGLDIELDPRSTLFGRVKIPGSKNYIDLTAGIGSYIALATKEGKGQYKDSSGKIVKLNDPNVYKGKTRLSVGSDFLLNKMAPGPGIIKGVVGEGKLYGGKKPTLGNVSRELFVPITADNWYDYFTKEELTQAMIASIADTLGVNVTSRY